jgi:hypothetical protein
VLHCPRFFIGHYPSLESLVQLQQEIQQADSEWIQRGYQTKDWKEKHRLQKKQKLLFYKIILEPNFFKRVVSRVIQVTQKILLMFTFVWANVKPLLWRQLQFPFKIEMPSKRLIPLAGKPLVEVDQSFDEYFSGLLGTYFTQQQEEVSVSLYSLICSVH